MIKRNRFVWQVDEIEVTKPVVEGGAGSGNFGHAGRPGEVGGSGEGGSFPQGEEQRLQALAMWREAQAVLKTLKGEGHG